MSYFNKLSVVIKCHAILYYGTLMLYTYFWYVHDHYHHFLLHTSTIHRSCRHGNTMSYFNKLSVVIKCHAILYYGTLMLYTYLDLVLCLV